MTQNWKEIWNRRSANGKDLNLDILIKLDGFDTGAGRIKVNDWRKYSMLIADKLNIKDHASVFEVGCGAGAFLFALQEQYTLSIGGIDYSASLIAAANRALPDGDFKVLEAQAFNILPQYDYVIANGVFHYFDLKYAALVLEQMIKKARFAIAVMEIPDLQTKDESEAVRREMLSIEEYNNKYTGLEHTYFARDWFKSQVKAHGLECELFDGCVPNYVQNRFRFGCIIRKMNPIKT